MSFRTDLKRFVMRTQQLTQDIFVGAATEAHRSVQLGSEITSAPGQPVDTANLRNSWQLQFPSPTTADITTNVAYAPDVEHNLRGVQFKNHGPHSVKLTTVGFPKIVKHVANQVKTRG